MENPLEIELIVDTLFKFLDKSQLISCRQVCKLWRRVSLPIWVKYATITCGKDSVSIKSPDYFFNHLESYSRCSFDFKTPLYENFDWQHEDDSLVVNQLLPRCGYHMKKLKLIYNLLRDEEGLRKLISSELTPKLQDLEINMEPLDDDTIDEIKTQQALILEDFPCERINRNLTRLDLKIETCVPFRWIDLLIHFPLLQNLSVILSNFKKIEKCHMQDMISALHKLRKTDRGKWALTDLRLSCPCQPLRPEVYQSFTSLDLPLKLCRIEMGYAVPENFLRDIAACFQNTLEKLTVEEAWYTWTRPNPASNFFWNETLTELYLQINLFRSFSFLRFLPNLKTLSIGIFSNVNELVWETMEEDGLVGCALLSMTSLNLGIEEYNHVKGLSELSIAMLMSWMPNLEKFVASWSKDSIEWICENSCNLKLSHIGVVDCDDDVDEDFICKNIVKLTGLRSLEILKSDCFPVTENTITNEFLHLSQFERLSLKLKDLKLTES